MKSRMMNVTKKLVVVLSCALVLAVATPAALPVSSPFVVTAEAATKKVKLNKTSLSMSQGAKETLKVSGTNKKIKWKSSNTSVASVSKKGVVTAKKAGKSTITAKVGGKKLTCKVTVKKVKKISGSVNQDGISFKIKSQKVGAKTKMTYANNSETAFKFGWTEQTYIEVRTNKKVHNLTADFMTQWNNGMNVVYPGDTGSFNIDLSKIDGDIKTITVHNICILGYNGLPVNIWNPYTDYTIAVSYQ